MGVVFAVKRFTVCCEPFFVDRVMAVNAVRCLFARIRGGLPARTQRPSCRPRTRRRPSDVMVLPTKEALLASLAAEVVAGVDRDFEECGAGEFAKTSATSSSLS